MYLKLTNGQPEKYSIGQFRRDNAPTAFPKTISEATLASHGVYPYTRPEPPVDYDSLAWEVVDGSFEQDSDGKWTHSYALNQLPLDQAQANIRSRRNSLLAECDWTQLPDATVDAAAWATYRQALRDVTAQDGFPFAVVWPTNP